MRFLSWIVGIMGLAYWGLCILMGNDLGTGWMLLAIFVPPFDLAMPFIYWAKTGFVPVIALGLLVAMISIMAFMGKRV